VVRVEAPQDALQAMEDGLRHHDLAGVVGKLEE
jgi:hypothetical protein